MMKTKKYTRLNFRSFGDKIITDGYFVKNFIRFIKVSYLLLLYD